MSLADWVRLTGIKPTHPTTECGAVSVLVDFDNPGRPTLWRLTDYKVSTAAGCVIWLVPTIIIDKGE